MQIKVLTHQVRDNLFVVSSDLKSHLERNMEPSEHIHNLLFNTGTPIPEIVEDKFLPDMTVMVPDRKYFDKKIDIALAGMKMFAETYLKN